MREFHESFIDGFYITDNEHREVANLMEVWTQQHNGKCDYRIETDWGLICEVLEYREQRSASYD